MESICKRCKYSKSCKGATTGNEQLKVTKCSRFEERTLITNADKIRSMTDEELAGFVYDRACAYCPMDDCEGRMTIGRDACYKRWLDWLKQGVKNEYS